MRLAARRRNALNIPKELEKQIQQRYTPAQQPRVQAWLTDVRARLGGVSRRHAGMMLRDHLEALALLTDRGLPLEKALARLDPGQLGGFYLSERTDWYPLDHAAKIYPMSMGLKRMMVFRLSCYLKKPVEPAIMQMALSYTIRRFPYFATTVKCGFFWHYIDSAMRRFAVRQESKLPCAVMKLGQVSSPTLRVVYWQNRVSVEFFHILTDGTGGSVFLRTLVKTYLRLLGESVSDGPETLCLDQPPDPAEWRDDFVLGGRMRGAHGFAGKPALQMRGMPAYEQPNRVLHFNFSTSALLDRAHEKGVTVTTLMLGYLMLACRDACPRRAGRRKIQIQLPVNMRRFYSSRTLRNFSLYCSINLPPDGIDTLDGILPLIDAQVKAGSARESLDETLELSRRLVRWLRFVPLIIKRPIAYLIYGTLSDMVFTTTFSNLGPIGVPRDMAAYIDKFDFVLGAPIRNRACCSLCSFQDRAVLTVTKNTPLTLFEDSLYRHFVESGLEPYMEGTS